MTVGCARGRSVSSWHGMPTASVKKQAFPALARHRKPVPLETVLGVQWQSRFSFIRASDLAVIVSEHNPQEALNQKSAWITLGSLRTASGIPPSFPSVSARSFNDDEMLRKSIRSNQRQFLGNIDKLRGKTEMHLKIFVDDCCGREIEKHLASESVGRAYLSNLRENASRARERQTRARAVSFPDAPALPALDEDSQLPADG